MGGGWTDAAFHCEGDEGEVLELCDLRRRQGREVVFVLCRARVARSDEVLAAERAGSDSTEVVDVGLVREQLEEGVERGVLGAGRELGAVLRDGRERGGEQRATHFLDAGGVEQLCEDVYARGGGGVLDELGGRCALGGFRHEDEGLEFRGEVGSELH